MKKILFIFAALTLLSAAFLGNVSASSNNNNGWSACILTAPQCGTDNGTQSKTITTDFTGICPTHYNYQNSGNWDQRCHRDNNASHSLTEHVAPIGTSCPNGYTLSGSGENTVCSQVQTQSCHIGKTDYSACTPAGQCPTACGNSASQVPNGLGGFTQCSATPACVVDVCPNIDGTQASVPDGYFKNSDGQCIKQEVTPIPTQGATPTPTVFVTPTPTVSVPTPTVTPSDPGSNNNNNNNGGNSGSGDGRSDGLSSCPSCTAAPTVQAVSGTHTQAVLGASTMADTGTFETTVMNIMAGIGMMFLALGAKSYAKEKTKN